MEFADLDAVMRIADSLQGAPQWGAEAYAAAVLADGLPKRIALVAEDEQYRLSGFVVGIVIAPEGEIESIGVVEDMHRQGIGKALLAAWRLEARAAEVSEIFLEVRASNLAAIRLYLEAGFEQAGCRAGYYSEPEEDALLMRVRLEA